MGFLDFRASAGFLTRYERELREPLVWRPLGLAQRKRASPRGDPPPEDLPNQGIEPTSLAWQADSLPLSHQEA